MHVGGDHLAPRPKLLRRTYFNATFFCHLYTIQKILFLLLNFYFCDSTAMKNLINLSHYFSTNTLLLLNRTCKYFIRVSCVRESTDAGRQLIYTKQGFCYKSKDIFHGSKKGFFISGISTGDTKWWAAHKFISKANLCKHLSKLTVISIFLPIKYNYIKLLDLPLILDEADDNDDNQSILKFSLCWGPC